MRLAQVAAGNDVIPERRKFSWKPVCRTLQHHSRLHWDSSATERASRPFVCSDTSPAIAGTGLATPKTFGVAGQTRD